MASRAYNMKVLYIVLLCGAALVDSRAAGRKRLIDTNLCQPLPAPTRGTIACGVAFPFYSCTASCDIGYQFPSGKTTDKRECDQMFGEWFDPPGKHIPDCVPTTKIPTTIPTTIIPTTKKASPSSVLITDTNLCQPLPAPSHGTIACGLAFPFYSCTALCDVGYQFPSGKTSDKRECDHVFGEWFKPPGKDIPDCVPLTTTIPTTMIPTTKKALLSSVPTTTTIPTATIPTTTIPTTTKSSPSSVLNTNECKPLLAPTHGKITCGPGFPFYSCTASCDTGYHFPSGKTSDTRECDQMFGEWFKPPGKDIPDCVPTTTIPTATIPTTTIPTTNKSLPSFVFNTSECKPLRAPTHGTITCGPGFPFYSCTASCDTGYHFPSGKTSDTRECDQMFGEWFKPPGKDIPDCVPLTTTIPATTIPITIIPTTKKASPNSVPTTTKIPTTIPTTIIPTTKKVSPSSVHITDTNLCQPLPAPSHGTIACGLAFPFYSCTALCDVGYQFPSGKTSDKRECDHVFGEWFKPPGKDIPNCVPLTTTIPTTMIPTTKKALFSSVPTTTTIPTATIPTTTIPTTTKSSPSSVLNTNECKPLLAPTHGTITCGPGFPFYSCTASCDIGYHFPSGKMSDTRECDQMFGEWFKPPGKDIPDCVHTSECKPLRAPTHGTITCGPGFPFYSCTASCDTGYHFPSGKTLDTRECDQMFGEWFKPPGKDIPDCVPTTTIPTATIPTTTIPTTKKSSPSSVFNTNECKPLLAPTHGTITCGPGFPFYSCTASCDTGYQFPSGKATDKRDCDQMFGEWFDPPGKGIPDCFRKL